MKPVLGLKGEKARRAGEAAAIKRLSLVACPEH